jgi:hypothetical protein
MATLRISRDRGYADKIRAYKILLNDVPIGKLNEGKELETQIPPGKHRVKAKIDWCGSPELEFEAIGNEQIIFKCESNLRGLRVFLAFFFVLLSWNQYLKLTKVS